jgi:serine/threonine protein kinase
LNVLIDDNEKAVLCDFGLSCLKADVTIRTARVDGEGVLGSPNWMAPERLLGGSLKMPCDIYAFAMTLYEVSFCRFFAEYSN